MNRRHALKAAAAGIGVAGSAGALGAERRGIDQEAREASAPENGPPPKYLVLACDGGGIRGLLTSLILERLEQEVPFIDRVNLFAGTSTGGIIALGLASEMTPKELVDLYGRRGSRIFDREATKLEPTGRMGRFWEGIKDHASSFSNHLDFNPKDLIHAKYPSDGLKNILTAAFADKTFRDLKPGRSALVTTLRLSAEEHGWTPLVLHNLNVAGAAEPAHVADGPTLDTRLVDAAMCTSAAPLYFPPYKHPEFGYCVDGGLFANCPAGVALALATRASYVSKNAAPIAILSIGTGAQTSGIEIPASVFERAEDYGALAWLSPLPRGKEPHGGDKTPSFPLVSALFDASSASHNYICKQTLGAARYRRVQVNLTRPIALDAINAESKSRLHAEADEFFGSEDWKGTVDWLRAQLV